MHAHKMLALIFTVLILVFAARESWRAGRVAWRVFKRDYRMNKARALAVYACLVAISVGPVGYYALEAGGKLVPKTV